jgi:predicted RNA methylase
MVNYMSGEVLLVLLILVVVIVLSTVWTTNLGAPWIPTSMKSVHTMLRLAAVGPKDIVYDLGCGDGRILITAARHYGARAVGIEIDPLRYIWCQLLITILGLRGHIKIIYGNFFHKDLSEATLITCYLLQETNDKLVEKFKKELHPGTKIVSNNFKFSGLKMVHWDDNTRFYLVPPNQNSESVH